MNEVNFPFFYPDSPETFFAVDLVQYVMNEHRVALTIRLPELHNVRRLFTSDFGKYIMLKKMSIRNKLDLLILRSFSSGVFNPSRLFYLGENILSPRKPQLFIGFSIYCAIVSQLSLYSARTNHPEHLNLLINTLSCEMSKYKEIFLCNDGWRDFQEYISNFDRPRIRPSLENSPFRYDSPEIFFAVGLIQYVLNEYQISFETIRLPFLEEARRMFTSDFGRLVVFKTIEKKRMLDVFMLLIIRNGQLHVGTLLQVAENLFDRTGEWLFSGFTFYCAIVSQVCLRCADFHYFSLMSLLTNALSYEMLKYRPLFVEHNFWRDFQENVRIRNEENLLPAAA